MNRVVIHLDRSQLGTDGLVIELKLNKELKNIGKKLGLSVSLTMYVARHSRASMARHLNVPLTIISKAMGHESEKTTQIYLKNFESDAVMRASQRIIREIEG